jgi:hypothetical protein
MKLEAPVNSNYAAVVVQIKAVNELENCDYVVGTPLLGFQAIVGKDTKVGDIGIVFPAETQLSHEFASYNNLYRHDDLNRIGGTRGYLEDNRRVKAMKFRGHRSSALFMPLESLEFTGVHVNQLKVGDTFDKLGDQEICRKYVVKTAQTRVEKNKLPKERRVDEKFLPQHYDTDNYFRNADSLPEDATVVITAKLHGTSIRIANTQVKRKLSWKDRLAKRLGVKVQETEYDYVYGSRRVIKDPNDPDQNHFYQQDIWTKEGARLQGLLPEGFIVYGELIGWVSSETPIQKNYTYGIPQGVSDLYVYRVAYVNPQGRIVDLAWDQVKEFCKDLGIKYVPELGRMSALDFKLCVEQYLDVRFNDLGWKDCPPLDAGLVDEGVCVRVDGLAPYLLKAKSPLFFEHETKLLTEAEKTGEVTDLEADA